MRYLRAIIFVCLSFGVLAQTDQPLTNKDIINMTTIGLPSNVIIAKINKAGGKFDTSPTALKALKDAGVQNDVILVMIEGDQSKPQAKAEEKQTESASAKESAKPIKKPGFWGKAKIEQRYDKFKDYTAVRSMPLPLSGTMALVMSDEMISLLAGFIFNGQEKKASVNEAMIALQSSSKNWVFLKESRFIALVDGRRIDLGEAERDSSISAFGGVRELVAWKITRNQLEQIAYGNSVEIQAGRREYKLKDNHLYALREIVEMMK